MKSWFAIFITAIFLPSAALAEESKSFWAKLLPDNSSALDFVDDGKAFLGQLLKDGKDTGQTLIESGKGIIDKTGETIKSLTGAD